MEEKWRMKDDIDRNNSSPSPHGIPISNTAEGAWMNQPHTLHTVNYRPPLTMKATKVDRNCLIVQVRSISTALEVNRAGPLLLSDMHGVRYGMWNDQLRTSSITHSK